MRDNVPRTPSMSEQCPEEKESSDRSGGLIDVRTPQVNNGHARRKDRNEQHDDLTREPLAEDQRSVKQGGRCRDAEHGHKPGLVKPANVYVAIKSNVPSESGWENLKEKMGGRWTRGIFDCTTGWLCDDE